MDHIKSEPCYKGTILQKDLNCVIRFPTMWCMGPAKVQTSLRICAVCSEPLLVA